MIVWRDGLSVGNSVIDSDHKALIDMINAFEHLHSDKEMSGLLKKLYRYASEHFTREENIQKMCQYPYAEAHHKAHEKLLGTLTEISHRWFETTDHLNRKEITASTAALLRDWLIEHIIGEDLRMKNYVNTIPAGIVQTGHHPAPPPQMP